MSILKKPFLTEEQLEQIRKMHKHLENVMWEIMYDYMVLNSGDGDIDNLLEANNCECFEHTDQEIMTRIMKLLNERQTVGDNLNFVQNALKVQEDIVRENLEFAREYDEHDSEWRENL